MNARIRRGFVAVAALAALAAGSLPATAQSSTTSNLDISLCSPQDHAFTLNIDNGFLPLAGATWTLVGPDVDGVHGLLVSDLHQTRSFTQAGWGHTVSTEVIEEREWLDNGDGIWNPATENLLEVSRNFYAQTATGTQPGTVCYFGEDVDIYDGAGNTDSHISAHTGAWNAGDPANQPGIFMPAAPKSGQHYYEESAAPIATDQASIIGVGTTSVPYGSFPNAIRVKEFTSLERGKEYKSYAPGGVGPLIDDTLLRCNPGPNCSGSAAAPRR